MCSKKGPKYSILIPTRNGARYLGSAVKSVLCQAYESCEVVVSVNYSIDDTLEILKGFDDPRLSIVIPPKPLSMAAHYEWLLGQARGEWITILGDDDALMPYFFDELEKLVSGYPEVKAISSRRAYYFWAGCEEVYGPTVISYHLNHTVRLVNTKFVLFEALTGLRSMFDLPQIYTNNVIHASIIDRIRKISSGRLYYELTPDIYSGVAITLNTKYFLKTEMPLFWVGTSPKSNGIAVSRPNNEQTSNSMKERAKEFISMSESDGIGVAKEVGMGLWKAQIGPALIFSSICQIPFLDKNSFWRSRCIGYLAYAAILRDIKKNHRQKDHVIAAYVAQIEKLRLNRNLLGLMRVVLATMAMGRWFWELTGRILHRLGRILFKDRVSFISVDRMSFPNIDSANLEVARRLEKRRLE